MKAAEIAGKNNPSDKPNEEQKKWWVEACDRGKVLEACTNLGLYYNDHDEKKLSLIYLEKACAPANPRGCSALGFRVRENGDINKAETYYSMACAGNYEDSCETLEAIRKEIAEIKNKKEAQVEQNRKLCAEGVRLSCYQMGEYYYELGLFKYAIEDYIKACNGGYAPGCNGAGWVYRNNLNKPADAKKYYLLACDGGHPTACNRLGIIESNKGNQAEAAKFYTKACSAGNTTGCNNLAKLQIDYNSIAEARKYLNEACDSGSNAACQKLVALTKEFK
jgi:TPR repeat protein